MRKLLKIESFCSTIQRQLTKQIHFLEKHNQIKVLSDKQSFTPIPKKNRK